MPAARASAGALPLTAPPPWSSDHRGTTGGQQLTTHCWVESHNNSSLGPTTKTRQWGLNSGFPHPGCHCTPCAPAGNNGSNFNLQGCLGVAPRSTSIHHKSGQYCQSLGTIIQDLIDQKILEGGCQVRVLAGHCKSNKGKVQLSTEGTSN